MQERRERNVKSFSDTAGVDVNVDDFNQPTHWMTVKEAENQIFVVTSANKAETKWGTKYFIHAIVEGDEDAVEYTISASDQSALFHQIEVAIANEGKDAFPFRAQVVAVGRTYAFQDPPAKKSPPRPPVGRKGGEESPY